MPKTVTLKNCVILTVDQQDTCYTDGVLILEGNRVKAVGERETIPTEGEVIDLQGKLVMPGLINTHTHSHSPLFREQADDLSLMDWLNKAMWPMERHLNSQRAQAATALSCLEYIQNGITCYADQFYFADDIAKVAQQSGLRCFLAATVFSGPCAETDDTFDAAQWFIQNWHGKEEQTLVYPCIGPHAPYTVDQELWRQCAWLAEEYGILLHTHISETQEENQQVREKTGHSPTRWLAELGVLKQRVLAAHSIHLDQEDLELYQHYDIAVSYNPVSNLKLVSGIMPLLKMRQLGIRVSIGTDGAQSNNSMDLLRDLRTGALLQKQFNQDATCFTARHAVRMATIDGAAALGMDGEIGSLEPGKQADLITLDTTSPRLCPLHPSQPEHLYATIAYSACGADVSDVMVNGRWLMRDKMVQSLDAVQVRSQAQQASEYLLRHMEK